MHVRAARSASPAPYDLTELAACLAAAVGLPPASVRWGRAPSRATGASGYRAELDVIEVYWPQDVPDASRRGLLQRGLSGLVETLTESLVDRWQVLHGSPGRRGHRTLEWLKAAAAAGLTVTETGLVTGLGPKLLRQMQPGTQVAKAFERLGFDVIHVARPRQQSRLRRLVCKCGIPVYVSRATHHLRCEACGQRPE